MLEINKREAGPNKPVTLQQRTYIDDQGRAVPEGDKRAATLFGSPGHLISAEEAQQRGITANGEIAAMKVPANKEAKTPRENKQPRADRKDRNRPSGEGQEKTTSNR